MANNYQNSTNSSNNYNNAQTTITSKTLPKINLKTMHQKTATIRVITTIADRIWCCSFHRNDSSELMDFISSLFCHIRQNSSYNVI